MDAMHTDKFMNETIFVAFQNDIKRYFMQIQDIQNHYQAIINSYNYKIFWGKAERFDTWYQTKTVR